MYRKQPLAESYQDMEKFDAEINVLFVRWSEVIKAVGFFFNVGFQLQQMSDQNDIICIY